MPQLVEGAFRKMHKLGDRLDAKSPASELHKLRIRAKRLRYAIEFVAEIYGAPAQGSFGAS